MSESSSGGPKPPPQPRHRRPAWRTIVGILIVIAIAVGVGVVLSRCSAAKSAAAQGAGRPAITVGVEKAGTGDIPIYIDALGAVTPTDQVAVTPRVSGMLVSASFTEGQMVSEGQLLAQIDPRPFAVALQQAQAQQQRDQAQLDNARLDLTRYQTLRAQDSIAGQQVDTQAALVKQDEGLVASDQAAVANAQLNLSFCQIPAPISGRVGLRQIGPGNQVQANSATPITVVTAINPIDIVFSIPEEGIPSVVHHPNNGQGLAVTAYDRAGGTVLAQGTLLTIDNVVDPTTGTVKAKARFANPTAALFPNQFVNVTLLVDTVKAAVIVPTTAVRHGPQGDYVYVLQPDDTVKVRPVKTGPGEGEIVSIVTGLAAGETVITEGGDRLRDGAKVVLPGQKPAAGAAGAASRGGGRGGRGGGGRSGAAAGKAG